MTNDDRRPSQFEISPAAEEILQQHFDQFVLAARVSVHALARMHDAMIEAVPVIVAAVAQFQRETQRSLDRRA